MKFKTLNIRQVISIALLSCAGLIIVNYFTIKIMSATRSYVHGESQYAKAHNKAFNNLLLFLFTEENQYWNDFNANLAITFGDEQARIAMQNDMKKNIIQNGLSIGKNSTKDIDEMIWFFNTFKSVPFFKKAVSHWIIGDQLNKQLYYLGQNIKLKSVQNKLNNKFRKSILITIQKLRSKIDLNQNKFTECFGEGTRTTKKYLIWFNVIFSFILISTLTLYYYAVAKRITSSRLLVVNQKKELIQTIKDLNKTKDNLTKEVTQHKKIIGTISHDIQSPLKYIQVIAKHLHENSKQDPLSQKYISTIYKSSTQLSEFTKNLIDYSKIYIEERHGEKQIYSIADLIQSKILFFEELASSNGTQILSEVAPDLVSDINIRIISVLIHNLTDNAVKNTQNGTITIGSKKENQSLIYYVNDTGVGMKEEQITYYMTLQNNRDLEKLILSTYGIGLHLVMELLLIIKGKIEFESSLRQGTKVTVTIPIH